MKNYIQHGDTLPLTAPAGGVISGMFYLIGALFGVASISAAEGDKFEMRLKGVVGDAPKTAGQAWSEGTPLYWDTGTGKLTSVAGSLKRVAVAVAPAVNAATVGVVLLQPVV